MKKLRIALFAVLLCVAFADSAAGQHKQKASRTSEFLNSIGVVSSVSRRGETLEGTIRCIEYTGIRWIRAGFEGGIPVEDLIELNKNTGVRFSYGLLSGGSNIARLIDGAKQLTQSGSLIALEGPNEPNNWEIEYQGERGGGRKSWTPVAKLQRDLYSAARNEPLLAEIPVWSLSENGAQTDNTGLQFLVVPANASTLMPPGTQFADFANCHNYICHPSWPGLHDNQAWLSAGPGKNVPVDGLFGNYGTTWAKKFEGYSEQELERLPRVTTETGIAVGHEGFVTEDLQGRLFLDLYLSQFKRGWKYTAVYLLKGRADEPAHEAYAFYNLDYTPKKAAEYLHNFTTILADNDDDAGPAGELEYLISGDFPTVHDLLLQNNDGTFQLVIWGEKFTGEPETVTVTFGKKYQELLIFDPIIGRAPIDKVKNEKSLKLIVSDHPLVVRVLR